MRVQSSAYAIEQRFTETYRRQANDPQALREAWCVRAYYPDAFQPIQEGDLLAGRMQPGPVGLSPDECGTAAFGYYSSFDEQELASTPLSRAERDAARDLGTFWRSESTAARVRGAFPPDMAQLMPSDNWSGEPGVGFPRYRIAGGCPDFGKLLHRGVPGLREDVDSYRRRAAGSAGDLSLYNGMRMALDTLSDACHFYTRQADAQARATADPDRSRELRRMAEILDRLRTAAPASFREALQLFWLYTLVGDIRTYGRMDVYLCGFLAHDLDALILTPDEAVRLLRSLWQLMAERGVSRQWITVGGLGRTIEDTADRFALLAIESMRGAPEGGPRLALRCYNGMNGALLRKALDVIGEGGAITLCNDTANVPALVSGFKVGRREAEQYIVFGGGEYAIEHRSIASPCGAINLLKALEVTLRNGRDPVAGKIVGLPLGSLKEFPTFEKLWESFCWQVDHFVALLARQQALTYRAAGEHAAFLYLSVLYDECLERNRPLLAGGAQILTGTLETFGNASVADSLTAIKLLVYDQRRVSPEDLLAALDADFEGHEELRELLLAAPKYGTHEVAGRMLATVDEHVCKTARRQAEAVGLTSYLAAIPDDEGDTLMGRWTGASPDGRKAGESLNNGSGAQDAARLDFLVKPDLTMLDGAAQTLTVSRELFTTRRKELESLLDTYWKQGGGQVTFVVEDTP